MYSVLVSVHHWHANMHSTAKTSITVYIIAPLASFVCCQLYTGTWTILDDITSMSIKIRKALSMADNCPYLVTCSIGSKMDGT